MHPRRISRVSRCRVRVLGGSCLGVGGGADGNRDRGQSADGGWGDGGGGADGGTATGLSRGGRGFSSVEAGEQVDCDSGSGGEEDEGKGVLVFVLLFRIGLSRTDCQYVRVDEKFCFIAQ
jgi:hypothetical protein